MLDTQSKERQAGSRHVLGWTETKHRAGRMQGFGEIHYAPYCDLWKKYCSGQFAGEYIMRRDALSESIATTSFSLLFLHTEIRLLSPFESSFTVFSFPRIALMRPAEAWVLGGERSKLRFSGSALDLRKRSMCYSGLSRVSNSGLLDSANNEGQKGVWKASERFKDS